MSSTPEVRSLLLRDDRTALVEEPPDERALAGAVVSGTPPVLRLDHLQVRADQRGRGLGRSVLELVRAWAVEHGASVLSVEVPAGNPATTALSRRSTVLGEHLAKPVDPVAATEVVQHRSLTNEEFGPWHEAQVEAYAQDNLQRSGGDLERARERSRVDFAESLPDGLATADTTIVVLTADGERVGHLWLAHHVEPGLSFVYDVEVAEEQRGRGFGRAAMVVADALTREAGDDRIGLHVFGANTAARRLYRTHGYVLQSTTYDLLSPQTTSEDWIE